MVSSFLMKNGLPIYASGSGYKGDTSIDLEKSGRDERLQLFIWGESDVKLSDENSPAVKSEQKWYFSNCRSLPMQSCRTAT